MAALAKIFSPAKRRSCCSRAAITRLRIVAELSVSGDASPVSSRNFTPAHRCEYRSGQVMVPRSVQHSVEFAMECSDIRVWDHSRIHKDTPALPFCHFALKAEKPKDSRYPCKIMTFGDRLRAKRMDRGLYQKEVAAMLGVTVDTVCYWENNRVTPSSCLLPKLLQFLDQHV